MKELLSQTPPWARTDAPNATVSVVLLLGSVEFWNSGPRRGQPEPALGPQDAETTYFCNTCGQPLCARCREETHRARMFARHEIVALGQRSRDVIQKCSE